MVQPMPSMELLLALVQGERDKQILHFDAVDNKAGFALGFAGLLITLAPDVPTVFGVLGVSSAGVAAALALWTFWPRRFPVLEPGPLRTYLRAERAYTQLTVYDTLEEFVNEGSALLQRKGRRLRGALTALVLASASFGVGIIGDSASGGLP